MMIEGEKAIPWDDIERAKAIALAMVANAQRALGLSETRAGRLLANILDQQYPLQKC